MYTYIYICVCICVYIYSASGYALKLAQLALFPGLLHIRSVQQYQDMAHPVIPTYSMRAEAVQLSRNSKRGTGLKITRSVQTRIPFARPVEMATKPSSETLTRDPNHQKWPAGTSQSCWHHSSFLLSGCCSIIQEAGRWRKHM